MRPALNIAKSEGADVKDVVGEFLTSIRKDPSFQSLYEDTRTEQARIDACIRPRKSRKTAGAQLIVLRRWNSYTPLLPPSREDYLSKCGGYFMRTGDVGVVIDPGFNFIENFLRAGFRIDDIDHVLISHAHNDHTVELEGLFSLLFKRNKRAIEHGGAVKRIRLYMNLGAFKKLSGYFDLAKPAADSYIEDIVLLNRRQHYKITRDIDLFTTTAKHHEMITANYALGFILRIRSDGDRQCVVRFTCDTGWDEDMEKANKEKAAEFQMDGIDILVAHIGSLKESEQKYDASNVPGSPRNKKALYKNHLGLIGTVASIDFWKPNVVLLSEFGEEMRDVRTTLADELTKRLEPPVFATDLNFRIELFGRSVWCFRDRKFHPPLDITVVAKDGQLYPIAKFQKTGPESIKTMDALGKSIKAFEC